MDASMASSSMMMSATGTGSSSMASMTGMSMGGSDSMGGDSMSSMTMSMADMLMVFFTSTSTPLYSMTWTPQNTGQYAGTCIFLIIFAAIFRAIIAIRSNFTRFMVSFTHRSETDILRSDREKMNDGDSLSTTQAVRRRPWRTNEALLRAILDTILAGVSYLLMLAVMTMNVGYFMSILGGTFLGSFIFGNWSAPAAH